MEPEVDRKIFLNRRFSVFWLGSLLSNMGTWMQQLAEPWLILNLSGSSMLLGLDAFAMDAPAWALTLVGGWLADRADRRRVIFFFQGLQALCPIILIFLVVTKTVQPWMIILLSLVVGITDALSMPAFQAVVPSLVKQTQIGRAIALNSSQFNLSRVVGPALAGWIMARYGAVGCFGANAFSYLPLLLSVWLVLPKSKGPIDGEKIGFLMHLKQIGRNERRRDGLITVMATSLLCGPIVAFSPVLIRDVFHGTVAQFGMALTAFGIGGLFGALVVAAFDGKAHKMKLGSYLSIAFGFVIIAIALNRSFWLLFPLLALAGALMTMVNTSINSAIQAHAQDHLRGQIASIYMLSMRGGLSIGNLITGAAVSVAGISHWFLISGSLAVIFHLCRHLFWRRAER